MNLVSNFQQRLNEALTMRNVRPSDLSRKTGISKSLLSYYMSGKAKKANANNIYAIAGALHVNEAWLIGYDVLPDEYRPPREEADELDRLIAQMNQDQRDQTLQFVKMFIVK